MRRYWSAPIHLYVNSSTSDSRTRRDGDSLRRTHEDPQRVWHMVTAKPCEQFFQLLPTEVYSSRNKEGQIRDQRYWFACHPYFHLPSLCCRAHGFRSWRQKHADFCRSVAQHLPHLRWLTTYLPGATVPATYFFPPSSRRWGASSRAWCSKYEQSHSCSLITTGLFHNGLLHSPRISSECHYLFCLCAGHLVPLF